MAVNPLNPSTTAQRNFVILNAKSQLQKTIKSSINQTLKKFTPDDNQVNQLELFKEELSTFIDRYNLNSMVNKKSSPV